MKTSTPFIYLFLIGFGICFTTLIYSPSGTNATKTQLHILSIKKQHVRTTYLREFNLEPQEAHVLSERANRQYRGTSFQTPRDLSSLDNHNL